MIQPAAARKNETFLKNPARVICTHFDLMVCMSLVHMLYQHQKRERETLSALKYESVLLNF